VTLHSLHKHIRDGNIDGCLTIGTSLRRYKGQLISARLCCRLAAVAERLNERNKERALSIELLMPYH
jgi:hypothetical protein